MKKIINHIVIFVLVLIAAISSMAIESRYKNNLLNVELSQTPDNRVSVLLVFENPYTEPVKVIYKTDNEYNILLPETYHSVTSVSTVNALNIRSADVKLVPYFNTDNANGYTKIVIKTTRPVIFNAHASYITTKIAQNELVDKIERDEEFKITPTTLKTTPVKKPATQATVAKKPATKTQVAKKKQPVKTNTAYKKPAAKPVSKQSKTVTAKAPVKQAQKPAVSTKPQTVTQPTQKPVEPVAKIETPVVTAPVQPVTQPEPIVLNTQNLQNDKTDSANIFKSIQYNKNIALPVLIGGILLLLLFLLRILKKSATKHPQVQPTTTHQVFDDSVEDIPQEIKDLSWQEKYKFMKEKEELQHTTAELERQTERNEQLENIFGEELPDEFTEETQENKVEQILEQPEEFEQITEIQSLQNIENDPFGFNAEPVNEGFEPAMARVSAEEEVDKLDDMSDIEPLVDEIFENAPDKEELEPIAQSIEINESYTTAPIEPTLINQAKISKTKGFYLVRYENEVALMGYIKDQVFLIHSFNGEEQSFVQTRLTEKKRGSEIYLVRSDNYKALVQVSGNEMKQLITL